jgi:glutathione S-transferase
MALRPGTKHALTREWLSAMPASFSPALDVRRATMAAVHEDDEVDDEEAEEAQAEEAEEAEAAAAGHFGRRAGGGVGQGLLSIFL